MRLPICHVRRGRQQEFIITAYGVGEHGVVTPQIPEWAPCGSAKSPCRIGRHHLRDRKTGPGHPLVVVVCHTHDRFFTLYPPGYVPFGRAPLLPVDGHGRVKVSETTLRAFLPTLFVAVLVAAGLEKRSGGRDYRTLCRQVHRASWWCGLTGDKLSDDLAHLLDVGLLEYRQARQAYGSWGLKQRGLAVCRVLAILRLDEMTLARLMRVGLLTGVCGRPWWWDGTGYRDLFP